MNRPLVGAGTITSVRQLVIFDLDDTLCDYSRARRRALDEVFGSLDGVDAGEAVRQWSMHEPRLFGQMLGSEISLEAYRNARFAHALATQRPQLDHELILGLNHRYMLIANAGVQWVDGARKALVALRAAGVLSAVLTNGPADGQAEKIRALELQRYVDAVHVSAVCGWSKPDPRAFTCVLSGLGVAPEQAVMIGDDDVDMRGAAGAGVCAIKIAGPASDTADGFGITQGVAEALRLLSRVV